MPEIAIVMGLLVAVALLALAARRLHVPYPIVLVLGGLAIGLVPALPRVTLQPDIVFLVFLPPLIFAGGWLTSLRDFKANVRPIGLLAVGLVIFTVLCVAAIAHALIPGLPWAAAFVLGAIVAPTDAVAATTVFERLGVPRRIVTVLEGESLLNDATGLIAYRFAVAAVVTGAFSLGEAGLQFVISGVGGIAIGLAVAWLFQQVQRRIEDPPIEITLSILLPYATYLAAENAFAAAGIHLSGVLACAAGGIYASRRSSEIMSATTRIQAYAVWDALQFVLNGLVFILIGLQLPAVLAGLDGRPAAQLVGVALVIGLSLIVIRFVWVFPATYLPRFLSRRVREGDPYPGWRNVVVVAWTGMRGVVSLAAALALPVATNTRAPFPGRDIMLLVTFVAILVTLVLQGLSLPPLLRLLGMAEDGTAEQEELEARTRTIEAALVRLDELAVAEWTHDDGIQWMRMHYRKRRKTVDTRFGILDHPHSPDGHQHEDGADHVESHRALMDGHQRLWRELLTAERTTLVQLRNTGVIGDGVLQRVERDLDLEELRLAQV